jgi:hypothetical protein
MKTTLSNLKNGLLLLAPIVLATSSVKAVTLTDLLGGGTITSGNLEFFNFHNATQSSNAPSLANVTFDHISVIAIGGPGTEFGIRFQSSMWSLEPNKHYDLGFDFSVRTLSGAPLITGNTLAFSGDVGPTGLGAADIVEGVHDLAGNSLASEYVYIDGNDGVFSSRSLDRKLFAGGPYATIEVSKDFAMVTDDAAGSGVSVQYFDQTFSQVPEGGPGLLGTISVLGALCWVGRGRFRKSRV